MSLFQKKPQATDQIPLYTIGSNKTALIIGLGNPEEKFTGTRHNIGFAALDYFAGKNDFPNWINKKDLKSEISVHTLGDTRVVLCKPTTSMNLSGEQILSWADSLKKNRNIWIRFCARRTA
jgi:peptidyl-tRNA hydrolase